MALNIDGACRISLSGLQFSNQLRDAASSATRIISEGLFMDSIASVMEVETQRPLRSQRSPIRCLSAGSACSALFIHYHDFLRIFRAAFRPGAPMIPPPGCVAGAAHPQVADRRRVLRPAGSRPQEEQLFQRQLALEDIAFGQAELALEIERRQDLAVQDDVADVGRVLGDACRSPRRRTPRAARPRCRSPA